MAKPPDHVRALISHLQRTQRDRPAALLHVTLLCLFDLAGAPDLLPRVQAAMQDFRADAFRVVFDQIAGGSSVVLRGSEAMRGVRRIQSALKGHLIRRDIPLLDHLPVPHVTINYRHDDRGTEAIDPISWRVEQLLLVESVTGERRHVEHGRWSLTVAGV